MSWAQRIGFGTPAQVEVLKALEGFVREQIDAHKSRRNLWFPNDLSPADHDGDEAASASEVLKLRALARGLPAAVLVALALNLLTEEGLPHFHRLIATHMGTDSPWCVWNNLWTAEEDRHGCAIRDYVRDARLYQMTSLEKLQYQYIEASFDPDWEHDPYRLLAYTSLQEKATQVAHANTGRACASYEPKIQRILAHISGDESRHYQFYRAVFKEVLARDPDRALQSLLKVMPALAMPGHNIDGYGHMADVVRRSDIYGPRHYQKIVEELLDYWEIASFGGLSAEGQEALDKIMRVPKRLERMADYVDSRTTARTFSFEFLGARTVEL